MEKEKQIKEQINTTLEKTKKEQEKYKNERSILFRMLQEIKKEELEKIEKVEEIVERVIKLEEEKEKQEEKQKEIKLEIKKIEKEQVRAYDSKKNKIKLPLFLVRDKKGKEYTFFIRENAKQYIKDNIEFDGNIKIEVIENNNVDIENIINKIKILLQ